jgi:hypothetical protein
VICAAIAVAVASLDVTQSTAAPRISTPLTVTELSLLTPGEDVPPEQDEEVARESELLVQRLLEEPPPPPEAPVEPIADAAEPIVATEAGEATEPAAAVEPAETTAPAAVADVTEEPVPLAAQRWHTPATGSELPPVSAPAARLSLAWTAAGLLLGLVLAAQLIHYFRQDLVRHPQVGPPLRTAYDRLGLALLPNWDLGSFELRQWGNDANAAAQGSMVVRASLKNRAAFAQPHPILRLELEDRFGSTVATRDFEPADYLENPSQGSRLLAPGASSEAELLLIPDSPPSPKTLSQLPDTLRALHVPVDHRWIRATLPSATARSSPDTSVQLVSVPAKPGCCG